jgi:hypothetical protein
MEAIHRLPPRELEFFPTPPEITQELLIREAFPGIVQEPCCGQGHISRLFPGRVWSSDIWDYGYGLPGIDFVKDELPFDNIITNPPLSRWVEFKRHALRCARRKVAFLVRLKNLGTEMGSMSPLKVIYAFREPVEEWKQGFFYAWYVWEHGYTGAPRIEYVTRHRFLGENYVRQAQADLCQQQPITRDSWYDLTNELMKHPSICISSAFGGSRWTS